jgi:hypothetical protein
MEPERAQMLFDQDVKILIIVGVVMFVIYILVKLFNGDDGDDY